ncbi:MAG: hypothetical protein HQK92_16310, partial [Nitrospirae bacterium]|nr:hypothetical protein [Nitrospirota bacterium]
DTPLSTYLKLESGSKNIVTSAYHSGNGTWEYITVVYPFNKSETFFKISLINTKGIAKFYKVQPVVISDDRFYNPEPDYFFTSSEQFREKLNYKKSSRIRILVLGNSTIYSICSSNNTSISYILQQKLESLYPGKFEVINYGIAAWNLQSQIVSLAYGFYFRNVLLEPVLPEKLAFIRENSPNAFVREAVDNKSTERNPYTVATLKPDIIVQASMWNDLTEIIMWPGMKRKDNFDLSSTDNGSVVVQYFKALYNYMDNPSEDNLKKAQSIHDFALKSTEEKQKDVELFQRMNFKERHEFPGVTIAPLAFEEHLYNRVLSELIRGAKIAYEYLLNEFLVRAHSYQVWNLVLPSKGGANYMYYIKRNPDFMKILPWDSERYYSRLWIESSIQQDIGHKLSSQYNLPFINLASEFSNQYDNLTASAYSNLDYFCDQIHFTYRGNEWLVDRLFMQMKDKFEQMSGK